MSMHYSLVKVYNIYKNVHVKDIQVVNILFIITHVDLLDIPL